MEREIHVLYLYKPAVDKCQVYRSPFHIGPIGKALDSSMGFSNVLAKGQTESNF